MIGGARKQIKVRIPIKLTSVYVVPGIAGSLFSCKHGFEFHQIGTKLNDRLCLTLPTGKRLPFIEQGHHYAVSFYDEEEQVLAVQDGLDQGEADLMHARYSHFGLARMGATLKQSSSRATAGSTTRSRVM